MGPIGNPALAYIAVLAGIGLGYMELLRPGSILPGAGGATLAMLGVASLSGGALNPAGGLLVAAGILTAVADAGFGWKGLGAVAGTAAASVGVRMLLAGRIGWSVAVWPTAIWLLVSWRLAELAFRARAAKAAI